MKKHFIMTEKEIPIYGGDLAIVLTNDNEKLEKTLELKDEDEIFAFAAIRWGKNRNRYLIVLNFENSLQKIKYGTITHEAIHASHFIAKNAGIEPSFDNDEPITYLAEWITNEVHKVISDSKFKI